MRKIRVAISGYGNIGKFAAEAVLASPDMELAGIIRRGGESLPELYYTKVASDITELGKVDVALLCSPTKNVKELALKYLSMGVSTVDSFDKHASIYDLKTELDAAAKKNNAVSVISAGWDPGSDSVVRALFEAMAPRGVTHTNFGPGMSMGHTVVVKAIDGVADALSVTIPKGEGLHRRMVYVCPEAGYDRAELTKKIKEDPGFINDETHVVFTDDVAALADRGHGVKLIRKGVSGKTDNQLFELDMKMHNPALTSQIMASCARAALKQRPGAYTMIEIPVIDLLPGDKEDIIRKLV